MIFFPHIPTPRKDDAGCFHCKGCGMILPHEDWYCDVCKAERRESTKKALKKYGWLIAVVVAGALFLLALQRGY